MEGLDTQGQLMLLNSKPQHPRNAHLGLTVLEDYRGLWHPRMRPLTSLSSNPTGLLLDIWAWGTRTARIFDYVHLSGLWTWRQRPTKARRIHRLGDQDISKISGAIVFGR